MKAEKSARTHSCRNCAIEPSAPKASLDKTKENIQPFLKSPVPIRNSSCIAYIIQHGIKDYLLNISLMFPFYLDKPNEEKLQVIEEHYRHLFGLRFGKETPMPKKEFDTAEVMLIFMHNAISYIRGTLDLPPSPVILECVGDKNG